MKYFWFSPKDQRFNNWIFYRESDESGIIIRDEYSKLRCSICQKFDEIAAIRAGLPQDVVIRSKSDYLLTDDGIICVSERGQQILLNEGIKGLAFLSIPNETRFSIALPESFSATDTAISQMEFHRPCRACGRFRETCLSPTLASIALPSDSMTLCCPSVVMEGTKGRKFWYLASDDVVAPLRKRKLSGVEFLLAY